MSYREERHKIFHASGRYAKKTKFLLLEQKHGRIPIAVQNSIIQIRSHDTSLYSQYTDNEGGDAF